MEKYDTCSAKLSNLGIFELYIWRIYKEKGCPKDSLYKS